VVYCAGVPSEAFTDTTSIGYTRSYPDFGG
jgi:hypothetical protein